MGQGTAVMVGSMRPWTAVSADGPLNTCNAVGVAADPNVTQMTRVDTIFTSVDVA